MTLSPASIRAQLPVGAPSFFADDGYACPTCDWLRLEFYPWFWQMRTALGLRAYSRANDCDNFARAVAQAAQDCHALTAGGAGAAALAVGEFWYTRDGGGVHAICCAFVDAGRLIFLDPQSGDVIKLTPNEVFSCQFVRF